MYDIFYISKSESDEEWVKVKTRYPRAQRFFNITSFDQLKAKSFTKMFWVIWDDLQLLDSFDLKAYHATKWDDMYVHVFKNKYHYDGVCLFPKNAKISKREFDNRFYIEKKEVDIEASVPKVNQYDVVFISYNEPNADENYEMLKQKYPNAKRVHGVKGIHQAHIAAAKLAETDLFWVVDGDAVIVDGFNFDYYVPWQERKHVHVWRSRNPLNHLEYGYGGVKLLPKQATLNMNITKVDMTTGISSSFKVVDGVSNITKFNTDPFNTWKSAFRECVKLSSRIIERQESWETVERLDVWCNVASGDYADYAIEGAIAGRKYGEQNRGNLEALGKINDFVWLKEQFDAR